MPGYLFLLETETLRKQKPHSSTQHTQTQKYSDGSELIGYNSSDKWPITFFIWLLLFLLHRAHIRLTEHKSVISHTWSCISRNEYVIVMISDKSSLNGFASVVMCVFFLLLWQTSNGMFEPEEMINVKSVNFDWTEKPLRYRCRWIIVIFAIWFTGNYTPCSHRDTRLGSYMHNRMTLWSVLYTIFDPFGMTFVCVRKAHANIDPEQ